MVFSTVIIVGLAKELPGDRGPGRGRGRRLGGRGRRLGGRRRRFARARFQSKFRKVPWLSLEDFQSSNL